MKFQRALSDLLWVLGLVLVFWLLATHLELSERLANISTGYEAMQLDELPMVLVVLSLGLAWYSWRRSVDAQLEIQERVQSEIRVQELLSHNSDLAQRLYTAQEDERRALARELHDEMGQTCTAIRTEAAVLSAGPANTQEVLDAAQRIATSAQQIAQLTRHMLHRLRPAALDSMGLPEALQALCDQWAMTSGVSCNLDVGELPAELDDYVCVTIYRLVQESLTNVARHAHATQVSVALKLSTDKQLVLTIQDDGRGMLNPQGNHAGFGLLGMRERVLSLGGELRLTSQLGQGMQVMARLTMEDA